MSTNDPDPGGGGGTDQGAGSQFYQATGLENLATRPWVRFDLLGMLEAIVGGTILAWYTGIIGLGQGIVGAITGVIGFITDTQASLINLLFGVERVVTLGALGTEVQVSRSGIAAFALAAVSIGVAAYILNWGVDQVA